MSGIIMYHFLRTFGRKGAGLVALGIAYLVSMSAGSAQEPGAAGGRSMLWRVESEGRSLYILGSVHMLPKSAYPLAPAIEQAFEESDRIAFELNLDSATNMGNAFALVQRGTYQDGRTLRSSISPETYKLLQQRLKKSGIPSVMFDRLEPWMVAMMLSAIDMQNSGYENRYGIDMYFHDKAKKAGKEVVGLETIDFQVDLFDKLPEEAQEEYLKQTLEMSSDSANGVVDSMVDAWKAGDTDLLEKIAGGSMSGNDELYKGMLYDRNHNWVPLIEGFLQSGDRYLVVVGALHLVGDDGVIELLRNKGYSVEQL